MSINHLYRRFARQRKEFIGKEPCEKDRTRPDDGYRDLEKLKSRLNAMGRDVEGFSKEELLFIYCHGKP